MTSSFLTTTTFLGSKLYVVIIGVFAIVLILIVLSVFFCFIRSRSNNGRKHVKPRGVTSNSGLVPMIAKEKFEEDIVAVVLGKSALSRHEELKEVVTEEKDGMVVRYQNTDVLEVGGEGSSESGSGGLVFSDYGCSVLSDIGGCWGKWYTLRELRDATCEFKKENVIGEGGYGIVYKGVLGDGLVVAVKNLFNHQGQAEKEFKVEVEAIGKARHKNLVALFGYCVEGVERMLVYEFVDNGNLEQWLHGNVGPVSPLTWDIRMKIAIETAKGLAYLHEGLEPKVVHRDIKSSNILLDRRWNPKVSDFGLAKLLGSEANYVTTRVMGTFGYVAPEYASSGKLTESSDIYSFGILLLEIISGRSPVDYSKPTEKGTLVEWFKRMVSSRRGEEIVDPLIEVRPTPRALKRALLVCLRCIDLNVSKRPKMGQVVHMLEAEEFPYRSEHRLTRDREQLLSPRLELYPLSDGSPFLPRTPDGRS